MQNGSKYMHRRGKGYKESFRVHSEEHERFRQNRPVDDANFQISHWDFSDDMRDPELSFWGNIAPSIGFRGLEA